MIEMFSAMPSFNADNTSLLDFRSAYPEIKFQLKKKTIIEFKFLTLRVETSASRDSNRDAKVQAVLCTWSKVLSLTERIGSSSATAWAKIETLKINF